MTILTIPVWFGLNLCIQNSSNCSRNILFWQNIGSATRNDQISSLGDATRASRSSLLRSSSGLVTFLVQSSHFSSPHLFCPTNRSVFFVNFYVLSTEEWLQCKNTKGSLSTCANSYNILFKQPTVSVYKTQPRLIHK